jgi:hypothetical protein
VTAKVQKFRQLEVELGSILRYNVESVQDYSLLVNEEWLEGEVARDKEMALLMQERDYLRCCLFVLGIQFRNPATMEIQNIFNCQLGALKFHSTRLGARFGVGRDWAEGGNSGRGGYPAAIYYYLCSFFGTQVTGVRIGTLLGDIQVLVNLRLGKNPLHIV